MIVIEDKCPSLEDAIHTIFLTPLLSSLAEHKNIETVTLTSDVVYSYSSQMFLTTFTIQLKDCSIACRVVVPESTKEVSANKNPVYFMLEAVCSKDTTNVIQSSIKLAKNPSQIYLRAKSKFYEVLASTATSYSEGGYTIDGCSSGYFYKTLPIENTDSYLLEVRRVVTGRSLYYILPSPLPMEDILKTVAKGLPHSKIIGALHHKSFVQFKNRKAFIRRSKSENSILLTYTPTASATILKAVTDMFNIYRCTGSDGSEVEEVVNRVQLQLNTKLPKIEVL